MRSGGEVRVAFLFTSIFFRGIPESNYAKSDPGRSKGVGVKEGIYK